MRGRWKRWWLSLQDAVLEHPVEVLLAEFFCVLGCWMFEAGDLSWKPVLTYAPVLFLISYMLNGLTRGSRWHLSYFLSAFLFLPVRLWITDTLDAFYFVSLAVVQLLYFLSYWERDNQAFMRRGLRYVGACFAAGLLAVIMWGLFISIYYSIRYIFEIGQEWENRAITYVAALSFLGTMPLLFLMFNREKGEVPQGNAVLNTLINIVLSPVLLIYAVILYLYFIKVTVLWSLPKGAVAYIVISFTSALFLLRGLQAFVSKRYYDWFYRWSSWVVLPALAMFWVGTTYRIRQYGFTELRVYLVAVGLILTGMALLFFSKRMGRYLYVALLAVGLLASVTYIPGLTAKDIERISQSQRGNVLSEPEETLPPERLYIWSDLPVDIKAFRMLHEVRTYSSGNCMYLSSDGDTVTLYKSDGEVVFTEASDSLLNRQLHKVGLSLGDSIPESVFPELLKVDLDSAILLLQNIVYTRDSVCHVEEVIPCYYLER